MEIRQLEEILTRQSQIDLKIPESAAVVGCGGTGFWTAIFLAMSGVKRILLIDPDVVEASNLNRLPLSPTMIGNHKTTACKNFIEKLRNGIEVEEYRASITQDSVGILANAEVVFCCTDNIKSQQIVYTYCNRYGKNYQRIGYDGTVLNVSRLYPMTLEETEDTQNGYEVTPSWVCPASAAAALGVASQLYKEITLLDDISLLRCEGWGIIPKVNILSLCQKAYQKNLFSIEDIDDEYGYCPDCDRSDCSDCDRGYCPDCERGDCNNCTVGDDEYNRGFDEGFEKGDLEGYDRGYQEGEEAGAEEAAEIIINHLIGVMEDGEVRGLPGLNISDSLAEKLDIIMDKLIGGV